MYSSVVLLLCLFLFHAVMTDSTMDLLKLSTSNQVLVLNSQIKDQGVKIAELKALVEHQFAKENLKLSEENAKFAKVESKIGKLESEIAKLTHSQVTITAITKKQLPTITPSPPTTTTTPLTTTAPSATTSSTTMPLSVGIKDQALLLHIKDQDIKIKDQDIKIKDQDIKIAKLETLIEHLNTKFAKENARFSEESAKFSEENAKFAKVETKIYKLETEIEKLTHSQAATTSSPSTTTSSPSTTTSSTQTTSSSTIDTSSGVVFTRWGRTDCPAGISTPAYNGTVGGSYHDHTGGAANRLCMPNDPTWDSNKLYNPIYSYSGYVYGGEYNWLPDSSLNGHGTPCSVCRAASFSTKVMIPGRDRCYPGWTKAYHGELVSGYHGHKAATEYACLDKQPQTSSKGGKSAALFYSVLAKCGLLPCPPYQDEALLTCVVCLK